MPHSYKYIPMNRYAPMLGAGGGAGSGGIIIPDPDFYSALNTSLIPDIGSGSYTFARASTATILDFEGYIRYCLSGESRFYSGRRVENLLHTAGAKSNKFDDGVWLGWVGDEVIAANQITLTTGSTNAGIYSPNFFASNAQNRVFVVSFKAYKVSGTSNDFGIRIIHNGDANYASPTFTLSGTLKRFSTKITITGSGTSAYLQIRSAVVEAGRVIHLEDVQIEDVTTQANQNPSEVVSYGMSEDHGCNADGVQYFATENGNTVTSNVVTEATGAALSDIAYNPSQQKTNLMYPSEDLTSVNWTKNNCAAANISTTIAGLASNTIKASDTNDVAHTVSNSITTLSATATIVLSAFVKAGTQDYIFLGCVKGAENSYQWFDITTGTVGSNTDSGGTILVRTDTALITAVNNGYLISVVFDASDTPGAHTVYYGVASTDGATTFAAATTSEVLCYMTGMYGALDHEVEGYIPTTSGTATKEGDTLSYDTGNVPAVTGEFTIYGEFYLRAPAESNDELVSIWDDVGGNAGIFLEVRSTNIGRIVFYDNTGAVVYRAVSGSLIYPGWNKIACVFSKTSGNRLSTINGVLLSATTDDTDATSWSVSAFEVSCMGSTGQLDHRVRNIKIFNSALDSDQLKSLTA